MPTCDLVFIDDKQSFSLFAIFGLDSVIAHYSCPIKLCTSVTCSKFVTIPSLPVIPWFSIISSVLLSVGVRVLLLYCPFAVLICFSIDLHSQKIKICLLHESCVGFLVVPSLLWREVPQCLRVSYYLHVPIAIPCCRFVGRYCNRIMIYAAVLDFHLIKFSDMVVY